MKALAALLLGALLLAGCNSNPIKPIENGNTMGVLLMHGKGGDTRWVDPLASILRAAGVQVLTPRMPWHRDRIYDKTFDDAMAEIAGQVRAMKDQGVRSVYLAGHSLGAIAAAGYAARHDDVQGIILLAPGHFTGWPGFHRRFVADLARADAMIAAGQGDETASFGDINGGKTSMRYLKANIFKSWFSDTGPAEFVANMKAVRGGIPILYVAGSQDRIPQTQNREYAFDKAPSNPRSRFVVIDSDHLDVPRKADETVIEWLRQP
jgi:pimeloyl-ACP methyl ester carboxylesterase